MSELTQPPKGDGEAAERNSRDDRHGVIHHHASAASSSNRLIELEIENSRLHRLVAELLLKNQELRKPD